MSGFWRECRVDVGFFRAKPTSTFLLKCWGYVQNVGNVGFYPGEEYLGKSRKTFTRAQGLNGGVGSIFPDPLYTLPDISDISDILVFKLLNLKGCVDVGFSKFQKS